MNMILDPTNDKRRAFPLLEDARLIRKQRMLGVIRQPRLSVFRAENQMNQILDQRLWHGLRLPGCVALSGLVGYRGPVTQGGASRLRRGALPLGYYVNAPSGREDRRIASRRSPKVRWGRNMPLPRRGLTCQRSAVVGNRSHLGSIALKGQDNPNSRSNVRQSTIRIVDTLAQCCPHPPLFAPVERGGDGANVGFL